MQAITAILSNPDLNAIADTKIFMAILLAMMVYRLVGPLIDLCNPIYIIGTICRLVASNVKKHLHTQRKEN